MYKFISFPDLQSPLYRGIDVPVTTPYLVSNRKLAQLLKNAEKQTQDFIVPSEEALIQIATSEGDQLSEHTWSFGPAGLNPDYKTHVALQGGVLEAGQFHGEVKDHRWKHPVNHPLVHQLIVPELPHLDGNRISVRHSDDQSSHYIATQAPLPQQFNRFWEKIVWNEDVSVILHLTNFSENNERKSDCYWNEGRYGKINVNVIESSRIPVFTSDSKEPLQEFRISKCLVTNNSTKTTRPLTIIQTPKWTDGSALSAAHMTQLKDAADLANTNDRILIHCSAGIGRTGQALAFFILDDALKAQQSKKISKPVLNPLKTAYDLRCIRPGILLNFSQYLGVYLALRERIKNQFKS